MPNAKNFQQTLVICAALAILTFAAFWNVRLNDFINYDDPDYVTENPFIQEGLTGGNVAWAFKSSHSSNWHPLTWMSHMLDISMFRMKPAGHHQTSLALHAANAILLFLLLQQMTGAAWRSAFVAALFAVHPLRVESVAWVSERKDVLSTLFWLLTSIAYVRYVRKSTMTNYVATIVLFSLGLMSKPMVVTLPFVLLLMDFWPLKRLAGFNWNTTPAVETEKPGKRAAVAAARAAAGTRSLGQLIQEKLPFFALMIIACIVTVWAQRTGGSVRTMTEFPMSLRFGNAFISYARYIEKMFWPDGLAVFYPHPHAWPGWQVGLALLTLAGVTFAAVKWMRKAPFVTLGWFWFIGTLVPVIGIVQVGIQAMADRYTYVPMIGLYIAVVWGVCELARAQQAKMAVAVAGALAVGASLVVTRAQVDRWRNSETLFRHTLKVTKENYTAHQNLGIILAKRGELQEAKEHFEKGLAIYPEIGDSHHNLGNVLMNLGNMEEAKKRYQKAVELKPNYDAAYMNLGLVAAREGKMELARGYFAKVVELKPKDPVARYQLGTAYFELGKYSDAAGQYSMALQLQPAHFPSLFQLGRISKLNGNRDEAAGYFRRVLSLKPDHAEAQGELAGLGLAP